MSNVNEATKAIIDCMNDETRDLTGNERAMVLLLVKEMITCAVRLDIFETLRPRNKEGA